MTNVNKNKVDFNNLDFHEILEAASKTSYAVSLGDLKDPYKPL